MILYQIFIYFYIFSFWIFSNFNSKAKAGWEARKKLFDRLKLNVSNKKNVVWVHCSSLGEFEQGRPLIEKIKSENKDVFLLLTFFSASGYNIQKNYPFADYVDYLPFDTIKNGKRIVDIVNPKMVIFVKYEFWWNLIAILQKKQVDTILISGIFRENQYFFKWYGTCFKSILNQFSYFFVQDFKSQEILKNNQITQVEVTGDTRIDRVMTIAKSCHENEIVQSFKQNKKLLICGSTWESDEALLLDLIPNLKEDWKIVIAPHEINRKSLQNQLVKNKIDFQLYTLFEYKDSKILILNTIGHLSSLYQYADLVYIGGGFEDGIHNILEPMAFGKTVIFGPNYQKFNEAITTVQQKSSFVINNKEELQLKFDFLSNNPSELMKLNQKNSNFMLANVGATEKIYQRLQHHFD